MGDMPRIATIFHVRFPQGWAQVLRGASDRCHGTNSPVICLLEIVFRLPKVDDFHLVSTGKEEKVCWFEIAMADTHRLQIAKSRNDRDYHFFELILLPEVPLLLALSEEIFQVCAAVHVLADHGNSVGVVHCLVEVIAEEL